LPIDADGEPSVAAVDVGRAPDVDDAAPVAVPGHDPDHPVYAIYTSGSTGKPKGVVLTHRRILAYLDAIQRDLGWRPGGSFAMVQSPAVDACKTNLYLPLTTGGCLHVVPFEQAMDPYGAQRYFTDHRIDGLKLAPSHLQALHGGDDPATVMPRGYLILGGEGVPRARMETLAGYAPDAHIVNHYGPTEATVTMLTHPVRRRARHATTMFPTGRPIAGTRAYLVDRRLAPVPLGVAGEIMIAGDCQARGYLGRPALTAEKFIPDPHRAPSRFDPDAAGARMYRSGDLAKRLHDGTLLFLGRADDQVKIRGYRIELGEVEAALRALPGVDETVAMAIDDPSGGKRLVAWYVADPDVLADDAASTRPRALREALQMALPPHMVPSAFVQLDALPRSGHGKLNRRALPAPEAAGVGEAGGDVARDDADQPIVPPADAREAALAAIWAHVLELPTVSVEANFFDLGGHSLRMIQLQTRLREAGYETSILDLFQQPTVRSLARLLASRDAANPQADSAARTARPAPASTRPSDPSTIARDVDAQASGGAALRATGARPDGEPIAIIGIAARFPGVGGDLDALWHHHLRAGVDVVERIERDELLRLGVDLDQVQAGRHVPARAVLDDIDRFDAAFFGYSPREAAVIDPQQRLLLEAAWAALEDAGYAPDLVGETARSIGVFAGASVSEYALHLMRDPAQLRALGVMQINLGIKGDYLPTRVSYKLGLDGPSLNVQTACSTSLTAVHLACRSLLAGECAMALAGGVSISPTRRRGYPFAPGGILAPDGRTRPFDADGAGTIASDGLGLVVLKPLADAQRDGDAIRAVIRGSAMTNDGRHKIGFTAPGVAGQARALRAAWRAAGIDPRTLEHVETHGTATGLGDPIETAALAEALGEAGARPGQVTLGAVKAVLGHTDTAAGVAGLIAAVLALEHEERPPVAHYTRPNPRAVLGDDGPLRVPDRPLPWRRRPDGPPRRAGVSSFGLGGTNVHVVLEEAPAPIDAAASAETAQTAPRAWQLLTVSGRDRAAVDALSDRLAARFDQPDPAGAPRDVADAAYTLQIGRHAFGRRRAVVVRTDDPR
ncbi:MAG: beta-ketoacyl synthase N-terminal-like domain-containing protein, partial [Acidobacteriota bacterium]